MNLHPTSDAHRDIALLHQIGERIAAADPRTTVLDLVVEFVSAVMKCDSCFVYVLEGEDLILRASQNPHSDVLDRLKLRMGQGITGWVAENKRPVAIARNALLDPRFQLFPELPEDRFEAFLSVPILCRDKLVGVINRSQVPLIRLHTPFENTFELDYCGLAGYSSPVNQTVGASNIPLWTIGSNTPLARDSESARKDLSMKHSVTACAFLLGYIAIYMCVGFAAVALVARAWLAIFE